MSVKPVHFTLAAFWKLQARRLPAVHGAACACDARTTRGEAGSAKRCCKACQWCRPVFLFLLFENIKQANSNDVDYLESFLRFRLDPFASYVNIHFADSHVLLFLPFSLTNCDRLTLVKCCSIAVWGYVLSRLLKFKCSHFKLFCVLCMHLGSQSRLNELWS